MYRILCIEDSPPIQLILNQLFSRQHQLSQAVTLAEARSKLASAKTDLIILDISLPDGDGLRFFSELKSKPEYQTIPVFILSGNQSLEEKTIGFQLGVDDYICKPFEPKELLLRVEAYLKKHGERKTVQNTLSVGDLTIDMLAQKVSLRLDHGNETVSLSSTEFKILSFLAKHKEHIKSREQIINFVFGESFIITDRTIDSHISRIRKKIKNSGCQLEAITHSGYRLIYMGATKKAA